jgi:hypothetical protein
MPRKPHASPWGTLISLVLIVALIVLARCSRGGGALATP